MTKITEILDADFALISRTVETLEELEAPGPLDILEHDHMGQTYRMPSLPTDATALRIQIREFLNGAFNEWHILRNGDLERTDEGYYDGTGSAYRELRAMAVYPNGESFGPASTIDDR